MKRRAFLWLAGSTAAALAFGGCAGVGPVAGPRNRSALQLVYQDWRTEYFSTMATQMLEQFHEEHPNIHVFYSLDPENVPEKMMSDFAAATAPDVFQGCCEYFPIWAQKGYLLDLGPYVEADLDPSTINDWDAAQVKALALPNGMQFALPKYHGALALYYNKDLFDRFGVPYPEGSWTHGDYYLAMRQFVSNRTRFSTTPVWGSMLEVSWERIQIHINAWGGHLVNPADPSQSMMARPEALDAQQWLRDRMWSDKTMATRLDVQNDATRDAFINGKVAMVEDGSWALKDILEKAQFRVGVTAIPAGPARHVTLATTDGYAIYAQTRYPEAAWELVKFLTSSEYGRAMAKAQLLQPARASLVGEWVANVRAAYPNKTNNLDIAAFAEGHIYNYSVTPEIFANMDEARRIVLAAWEQIFTLGRLPVGSMREVAAQVDAAQRQGG
jgi:multiple sugar transport system substrate-binding protein